MAALPGPAGKTSRPDLARLVPSSRATVITLVLAALALGLYLLARESSLFAVQKIEVIGAPPEVAAQVQRALAPLEGASLVTLDSSALDRRLGRLPIVASSRYDRDFPHTLRVFVQPERAVAVLRRGADSWLLSATARVLARIDRGRRRTLPRVWAPHDADITVGAAVSGDLARATAAVAPLWRTALARSVLTASSAEGGLMLRLRSGLELRLGDLRQLPLKLAIAARVTKLVDPGTAYVDLSVPGRPVSG